MGTICLDSLLLQGPIQFKSISKLSFSIKGNEHGHLFVTGFLEEDSGSSAVYKDLEGQPFGIYSTMGGLSPIFIGVIKRLFVHQINRQYLAEAHVVTLSTKLDEKKKSRSFQNPDMTYAELIRTVLQDTPNAAAICSAGEDITIGRPIFQYKETDWEFIKRIASELNMKVFPARETPVPQITVGLEGRATDLDFSNSEYIQKVDRQFYRLGGEQAGLYKPDFLCYQVKETKNLSIGSSVLWEGAPIYICEVSGEFVDGELIFTYILGRKGLVAEKTYQNRKMIGLSLVGTVKNTSQERVVLALDIDDGKDTGGYPFPWRPESGNIMYCMPKVGTRASLFLQNGDGSSAIALTSPRENGESCAAMSDPSMRCFTTEHGKQLFLYPESMGVIAGAPDAPDQINLDQLNHLLMESAKAFQMTSQLNIRITAPIIKLQTPQNIEAVRSAGITAKMSLIVPKGTASGNPPTGGDSTTVTLENQFNLKGSAEVLWGTEFHTYPPFNDAPNEFDMGGWIFNMVWGAILTVACVATAIAFPVVAPFFIGAAIGAAVATVAISVADNYSGNVRNPFDAAKVILTGAVVGAAVAGIPYIPAGFQAIGKAIADFAASTFIIPPLLPGLAGVSGGAGILGGIAISGQAILEGGALITGVAAGNALWGIMKSVGGGENGNHSDTQKADAKSDSDETYTGGRTQEELDDLARDPSHGNKITEQGIKEREVGLQLEERGDLGHIVRDTQADKGAEFIDQTTGKYWDVKSFESYPNGITSPRKGAFTVENAMKKILREIGNGHKVIVDTRNLVAEHIAQLQQAIDAAGISGEILWFP